MENTNKKKKEKKREIVEFTVELKATAISDTSIADMCVVP